MQRTRFDQTHAYVFLRSKNSSILIRLLVLVGKHLALDLIL